MSFWNKLGQAEVASLQKHGYEILVNLVPPNGGGLLVVQDPVICISGKRRWVEYQPVTLRTPRSVRTFISERN